MQGLPRQDRPGRHRGPVTIAARWRHGAAVTLVGGCLGLLGACGGGRYVDPPASAAATPGSPASTTPIPSPAPPAAPSPDAGQPTTANGDQCAEEVFRGRQDPLDIMLLVDSSASMVEPAGPSNTKWDLAVNALLAFVRDPRLAGLGLGLQFFPAFPPVNICLGDSDCVEDGVAPPGAGSQCVPRNVCVGADGSIVATQSCDDVGLVKCPPGGSCVPAGRCSVGGDLCTRLEQACGAGSAGVCQPLPRTCRQLKTAAACEEATYNTPRVPIGDMPGAEIALRRALEDASPLGQTPTGPAVDGVLASLRSHLASRPGRRAALVLATDGVPFGCFPDYSIEQVTKSLFGAFSATPSIPTYVIGVFKPEELATYQQSIQRLAVGGGTNNPFLLNPDTDLSQRLLDTLNAIRDTALGCDFEIPRPSSGVVDHGKLNLRIASAAGFLDLGYVGSADRCDPARGGWHYDVNPATGTPDRVLLCASTCRSIEEDRASSVEMRIGCKTRVD